jgi:hypothetical protein
VDWASLAARLPSNSPSELCAAKTDTADRALIGAACHRLHSWTKALSWQQKQQWTDNMIHVRQWRVCSAACSSSSDARERLYLILRRESRPSGSDTHELDMQDDETKDAKLICSGPKKVSGCLLELY